MRRLAAAVALAAAFVTATPAPSQAFFCAAWVGDLCVGPCGPVNYAYEKLYGGPILAC